jgi:hypothetical protein
MPKKSPAGADIQALDMAKKGKGLFGQPPPPVRKPSRGALGGTTPRSGRTRLPPEMAAAQRGGKRGAAKKKAAK